MLLNPDFVRETVEQMKEYPDRGDMKKAMVTGHLLSPGKKRKLSAINGGIWADIVCWS
jgi:hypothetical protein